MQALDPRGTATSAPARRLRRRLDRALRGGWIGRALAAASLAAAGGAALIAAGAAALLWRTAFAEASRWTAPPAWAAAAIALFSSAAAYRFAVTIAARRCLPADRAAGRLDRMGVALATEARHPRLGERLSRAVEFLDDAPVQGESPTAARADDQLAASLRRLAVAEAAAALDDAGDLAVPGAAARVRWIVAGLAVTAAVAVSAGIGPPAWRAAVRGQVFRGRVPQRPPAADGTVAAPTDVAAAIAAARHAVQMLRSALADDRPLPAERLARLAARARAAADAATTAARTRPAAEPAAMLALLATGLEDVAASLPSPVNAATTAAAATSPADDTAVALVGVRTRLDQLAKAADAGDRLVAAAALQARLAAVLARAFTLSPGVDADDLAADTQAQLERLADIAAECRRVVATDGSVLRDAAGVVFPAATDAVLPAAIDAVRRACDRLDEVAVAAAAPLPGHVAANRLGRAASLADDAARAIADAVDVLGMTPSATVPAASFDLSVAGPPVAAGNAAAAPTPAEPAPLARTRAALDRVATTILAPLDAGGHEPAHDAGATDLARGPPPAAAGSASPAGPTRGQPSAGEASAGDAARAGGDARVAAAEPSPRERVWMLLPARERPDRGGQAHDADATAAAYRPAIDAYYRLLFQSFSPALPPGDRPKADRVDESAAAADVPAAPDTGSAKPPPP
jgi:hypothetical protein